MFYTNLGRVVAGLGFSLGLCGLALGLLVASGTVVEPSPGAYLGSKTSGQWIDRGIYMIVFAIVVGVLTDISRSVAQQGTHQRPIEERGPLHASASPGSAGVSPALSCGISAASSLEERAGRPRSQTAP